MKKIRKFVSWTVAVLIVLVLLLVVAVQLFFPVDKAKEMAIKRGSEALGRAIDVQDVEVSIWGGLGVALQDVTVSNPTDWPTGVEFLKAGKIDVKLQFWPLLSGEYRLDRLIIEKPTINFRKTADGSVNYSFAAADTIPVVEDMPAEAQAAAVAVSFDRLEIREGRVEYVDDSTGSRFTLDGVDLTTSLEMPRENFYRSRGELSVATAAIVVDEALPPFKVRLSYEADYDVARKFVQLKRAELRLNDLEFSLTGELDHGGEAVAMRSHLRSDEIKIKDLFTLMSPEQLALLDGYTVEGDFSLDADVEYDGAVAEALTYSGDAQIVRTTVSSAEVAGELKIARAVADFEPDNLRLNIQDATFNDKPLAAHLAIAHFDDPMVTGELSGELDLAFIKPFLPAEDNPDIAGEATFALKVSGPVKQADRLSLAGTVDIRGGRYSADFLTEPVEQFDTRLVLVPDTLRIEQLDVRFRTSDMALTGAIAHPLPYLLPMESVDRSKVARPVLTFAMTSNRFNVDSLFPETSPPTGDGVPARPDTIAPLILPAVQGSGTVRFDTVYYMGVPLTNLTGDVTIDDRVVSITDVVGKVYSGDVTGKTSINFASMAEPVYDGSFNARQIEVNDFLSRFTKFGGYLFGKFDLNGDYSAAGLDADRFLNSLTMNSLADMTQGKVVTSGAIHDGLAKLSELTGASVDKEQLLKDISSKVVVENGRVHVNDLKSTLGTLGDVNVSGYYSFEGDIEYAGTILLSKETTKQVLSNKSLLGKAGGLFKDGSVDRIRLPLQIGGTIDKPKFTLDYSSVAKDLGQDVIDQAVDKLNLKSLFKKDGGN